MSPPTPGEVLRVLLDEEMEITQNEFAAALGTTRYSVNQLVNDRRAVTADMALRLARALSTTPDFWLNLQRAVDLHRARQRLGRELAKVRVVRKGIAEEDLFDDIGG